MRIRTKRAAYQGRLYYFHFIHTSGTESASFLASSQAFFRSGRDGEKGVIYSGLGKVKAGTGPHTAFASHRTPNEPSQIKSSEYWALRAFPVFVVLSGSLYLWRAVFSA